MKNLEKKSKSHISCCGFDCCKCDVYNTKTDSDRITIAKKWKLEIDLTKEIKKVQCGGCKSTTEEIFSHCNDCKIRECVFKLGFENCSNCNKFPCVYHK